MSAVSAGRNILISVLFIFLGGPALTLVLVPYWITRFRIAPLEPQWQVVLASGLILFGLAPLFESALRFVRVGLGTLVPAAPPERLVITGLYRYLRNPMYAGVLVSIAGEAILFRSEDIFIYLAAAWLVSHLFVCLYEEPTLARRYGQHYAFYKRHVPRWLPRFRPWHGVPE